MDITWLDPEGPDQRDLAGAAAVREAARAADTPHWPSPTTSVLAVELRHGDDGDPPRIAVARLPGAGPVVAVLRVELPRWDNRHLGGVSVTVDPRHRRRGLGRALFDVGVAQVRAAGRRLVLSACQEGTPGVGFLSAMGLIRVYREAIRRLDVTSVDWPKLTGLVAEAQQRATGYQLERVPLPSPESLVGDLASIAGAINDAPTGELDIEDEVFSPERIRAYEQAQLAYRQRVYRVVARDRATGALAGHTVLAVSQEQPWRGDQHDTSVLKAHRGHRLGLGLKIEMLRWLAELEPQLRTVDTGNAADNRHMIAVNEAVGFGLLCDESEWQRPVDP